MSDEGFHEIQLNGKQLVFLFMAAAVVLVVVFLAGVMVGRGVRAEMAAASVGEPAPAGVDLAAAGAAPAAPAQPPAAGTPPATTPAATPPVAQPPATPPAPVADDVSRAKPADAPGPKPAAAPAPTGDAGTAGAAGRGTPATGAPRAPESTSAPYAVQVAAPRDRPSAEAIAKRLVAKGYAAYVLEPTAGSTSPAYYRVRVGPFKTRREADDVRRRLEKEEQFKPFITR